MLYDKVTDIFLELQKELNIEDGGVDPLLEYDLFEKERDLSVLIGKILRIQRGERDV